VSRRWAAVIAILTVVVILGPRYAETQNGQNAQNQQSAQSEDIVRRAKNRVQPEYPDLARKMNISGTVKVEVTVAPNGTVKEARIVGGHPVLASAALEAAKKWRFEPASGESTGIIDFKFEPR